MADYDMNVEDTRIIFHNESLTVIGFGDKPYIAPTQLQHNAQSGVGNVEFRQLVSDLIAAATFNARVVDISSPEKFASEVIAFIIDLEYPHLAPNRVFESYDERLDLVDFLIAEVQIARLIQARKEDNDEMDVEDGEMGHLGTDEHWISKQALQPLSVDQILQQLAAMFDIDEMADYSVILDTVLQRLNDLRQQRPELFVGDLVFTQPISDTDLHLISEISAALRDEYCGRLDVLLKRLDVSLQSLLWSDKAKNNQAVKNLLAQQKAVFSSIGAPNYSLVDVITAQDDILHIHKTSESTLASRTGLAKVVIGEVVDRGGRVSEKRRAGMPSFQARIESSGSAGAHNPKKAKGPRVQGAGGGGRQEGSGRGRGGGWGGNKRGKRG